MNQLSWLIYLAGVTESFSILFGVLFWAAVLIGGVGMVIWAVTTSIDEAWEERSALMFKVLRWLLIGLVATGSISSVLPSKETVYAIAASEMGEEILKTPTATKAVKALDAWLDKQIAK